jgi:hypothetical protein
MTEYVYKLNLPEINQVLLSLDKINDLVPQDFIGSRIFYPHPRDVFKSEWLTYKNLKWDQMSVFIRSGKETSILHRDDTHTTSVHWGINWILSDDSVMQYWKDDSNFEKKIVTDIGGSPTLKMYTDQPADVEYKMTTGVYLINASVAHKVVNYADSRRIALSLRSKKFRYENPNIKWGDIVKMFEGEIAEN